MTICELHQSFISPKHFAFLFFFSCCQQKSDHSSLKPSGSHGTVIWKYVLPRAQLMSTDTLGKNKKTLDLELMFNRDYLPDINGNDEEEEDQEMMEEFDEESLPAPGKIVEGSF